MPSRSSSRGREAPPQDRERLLDAAGGPGRAIYATVRAILDELEAAAPWAHLYYPPEDTAAFVALGESLAATVVVVPERIDALIGELAAEAGGEDAEAVGDARFFFEGIHAMARPEIEKLQGRLAQAAGDGDLDADERATICEIAADLKGKYASSIMGAAASLIAQDRWHGVEIEPVLFPEKAEEFERNRLLVRTLEEVLAAIRQVPEEVPLPRLVTQWRAGQRVDQYALTPFYGFLGGLGKLLKETTRRALYSGDYHQIRKREGALASRVNELNLLHNVSWGTMPAAVGGDPKTLLPRLAVKATEIAAVLDVDLLRAVVGASTVKSVHTAVQLEGERVKAGGELTPEVMARTRKHVPADLHSLVPLLHDEDLKTFLDLLLGSVRKRASLAHEATRGRREPARAAEAAADVEELAAEAVLVEAEEPADDDTGAAFDDTGFELDEGLLPDVDGFLDADAGWQPDVAAPDEPLVADERTVPPGAAAAPASVAPGRVDHEARMAAAQDLQRTLDTLLARGNQERKAFDFLHRFVKQKRSIPPGMVKSVHPFLRAVLDAVLPRLAVLEAAGDVPASAGANLEKSCRVLLDERITPDEMRREVPVNMNRILHLLEGLASTAAKLVDEISPGSSYWRDTRTADFSREF